MFKDDTGKCLFTINDLGRYCHIIHYGYAAIAGIFFMIAVVFPALITGLYKSGLGNHAIH